MPFGPGLSCCAPSLARDSRPWRASIPIAGAPSSLRRSPFVACTATSKAHAKPPARSVPTKRSDSPRSKPRTTMAYRRRGDAHPIVAASVQTLRPPRRAQNGSINGARASSRYCMLIHCHADILGAMTEAVAASARPRRKVVRLCRRVGIRRGGSPPFREKEDRFGISRNRIGTGQRRCRRRRVRSRRGPPASGPAQHPAAGGRVRCRPVRHGPGMDSASATVDLARHFQIETVEPFFLCSDVSRIIRRQPANHGIA